MNQPNVGPSWRCTCQLSHLFDNFLSDWWRLQVVRDVLLSCCVATVRPASTVIALPRLCSIRCKSIEFTLFLPSLWVLNTSYKDGFPEGLEYRQGPQYSGGHVSTSCFGPKVAVSPQGKPLHVDDDGGASIAPARIHAFLSVAWPRRNYGVRIFLVACSLRSLCN